MKITQVVGWTLAGVLVGCGGAPAEAKKDEVKPEAKKDEAKPAEEPKKDEAKPADVPAASGGEWGVVACDSYMKTVADCKTFKQDSPVFKTVTDKWKKWKVEGKTEDLEKGCTKAAELFKCPAK